MELISQIINNLIDDESSLNSALLKTKVLASRIGNESLLNWTNSELSGYENDNLLPDYRKNIWNTLKGNMINGNMKYTEIEIPTIGLNPDFEHTLRYTNFPDSISTLENLIQGKSKLGSPIRAEVMKIIEENWRSMGNPYLSLLSCNKIISKSSIVSIISNVRSKLLDFMLSLENEFGTNTEIIELKSKNHKVTQIMYKTIITNTGDGNTINFGDKNNITSNVQIKKNDLAELREILKLNNVQVQDIDELEKIINTDNHNFGDKTFGDKTKLWLEKMMKKSIDGSWNVAIGAAGNLLAESLNSYLGF